LGILGDGSCSSNWLSSHCNNLVCGAKTLAEKRMKEADLQDRITFLLCDYRKTPTRKGGYDRIISVEMVEAVGREFLDDYFRVISDLLNPIDARIVIQAFTFIEKVCVNLTRTMENKTEMMADAL
jgi:cyclopropane fatty-acyl-phospholipid synthase-like methyltransferase